MVGVRRVIPILILLTLTTAGLGTSVTLLDPGATTPIEAQTSEPLPDTGVLPATVVSAGGGGSTRNWAAYAGDGTPLGSHPWKAYTVGGNCCEHYLTVTPDGTIVNLGSAYPTFSTDGGDSWRRALPANPMLGAEGAVVPAPGGDIVGMTWDPYTGDQVVAYRYDGETGTWAWNLVNLNTPFYDRPWISVAPGPFHVDGVEIPYVTFMRGGVLKYPQFMSLDGLHYGTAEHTFSALTANAAKVDGVNWLSELPDFGAPTPGVDFMQPHHDAFGTPLANGGYLAYLPHSGDTGERLTVLDQDLLWKGVDVELPEGELYFDGAGGIHALDVTGNAFVDHSYSADGGATWDTYRYAFDGSAPWGAGGFKHWEFKVNGELGLAVLLVRIDHAVGDQDLVFKSWDFADGLAPDQYYMVGNGDLDTGRGILTNGPRLDFTTLGILPDGRVVATFADRNYRPGFVIEQTVDGPAGQVGALVDEGYDQAGWLLGQGG